MSVVNYFRRDEHSDSDRTETLRAKDKLYYNGWLRKLPMVKDQSRRVCLAACSAHNRKIYEAKTIHIVTGFEV